MAEYTPKDPRGSARFTFDFTPALAIGDSCSGAPTVIDESGTLDISALSLNGNIVSARISGGVAGVVYRVRWTCSTAAGDVLSQSTPVLVEDL